MGKVILEMTPAALVILVAPDSMVAAIALVAVATVSVSLVGVRVLGEGYKEVPDLMLAMSVWVVVCAPLIWGIPLAVAVNRPELSVAGSFLGLVIGLTGFTILTPSLGLFGAALSWNATLISGFLFTAGFSVRATRSRLRAARNNKTNQ